MKPWSKIAGFVSIAIAALLVAAYLFLAFRGKSLVINSLESATKKKVTIESFRVKLPLRFEVKNLEIQDLAKIERVSFSPSIMYLVVGRLAINDIVVVRPEYRYERKPKEDKPEPQGAAGIPSQKKKPSFPPKLVIRKLQIKDGIVNFTDYTASDSGLKITVDQISLNLANVYSFPSTTITNFALTGRIPWQNGTIDGKVVAEGWLNYAKKDIQAVLRVEGIDGIYLYPYYSTWVDLDKARITQAKLNFNSNISGLNNNVTADCHLELADIVRKPLDEGESEEKASRITNAVLDMFRALNEGKIVLDFTIRTKMDNPQFGFSSIKHAFEHKLAEGRGNGFQFQDIFLLPGRLLVGTVKGATDLSKAMIDGTFAVGNEFKKAVQDTFNPVPAEENKE
jgi:hypothetical protein